MAVTDVFTPTPLSTNDQTIAQSLLDAILRSNEFRMEADGKTFVVPPAVTQRILVALKLTANDLPLSKQELPLAKAAAFLDVSETLLMELLLAGALPSRTDGKERWIELGELLEYDLRTKRSYALQEQIAAEFQDMGAYDDESPV